MTRRTKRVILGTTAVVAIVVIVFVGSMRYLADQRERQRYDAERGSLKPPDPVSVVVEEKSLTRTRKFTAEVEPWVEAKVPAEVSGRVIETLVEPGDQVKEGEVLVVLDDTRARLALDVAKARCDEAIRLASEAKRLRESRVVSKTALEAAEAEARVSQAQLEQATDELERHQVKAPFDGIVQQRLVDVGEAVTTMQSVAEVVDLDRLRVVFDVAASDLSAFKERDQLEMRVLTDGRELVRPTVKHLSPSANPSTRLYRVEAELPNEGGRWPGGLQGFIDKEVALYPTGPVVPSAAVRFRGKQGVVLRDTGDSEPEEVAIEIGPEIDGYYPVLQGVVAGDRIFIR